MQDINSVLFPVSASEKHPNTKEIIKIAESMGITQKEMAELMGCKQPYVNQLKQGKGLAKIADLEPLIFRISPKLPGEEFFQYTVFKHKTYTLPENWEKRVIVNAYNRHDQTDSYWSNFDYDDDYSYHSTDKYDREFNKIRDKHLSYLEGETDHIKEEVNEVHKLAGSLSSILETHWKKEFIVDDENTALINKARLLDVYQALITDHLHRWTLPFIESSSLSDSYFTEKLPDIDKYIEKSLKEISEYKEELDNKISGIEIKNKEKIEKFSSFDFFDKKALDDFISGKVASLDEALNLEEVSEKIFSDSKFEIKNDYQNISFDMASEFVEWAKIKGNISTEITTEVIQICGKSLWLEKDKYEIRVKNSYPYEYEEYDIYIRLIETNSNRLYIVEKDSRISDYMMINGPYSSLEIIDIIRGKCLNKIDIDKIKERLVKEGYPLPGIRYIY